MNETNIINKNEDTRNYGIDLLRIISMLMVILLHVLGQGGILANAVSLSAKYNIAWFLEIFAYSAVNIYAIISGYVLVDSKFKIKRAITFWVQVQFYSIIISILYSLYNNGALSIREYLFPISKKTYWYGTAYFGMYLFVNFINKFINSLKKEEFIKLLITIFGVLSVFQTITISDAFDTLKGYSMIWLINMYILGAYIKKFDIFKKYNAKEMCFFYLISTIFLTWCNCIERAIKSNFAGNTITQTAFIKYISPFIIFNAILAVKILKDLKINNKIIIRLIKSGATASFAVYLIHSHPLIYNNVIKDAFIWVLNYNIVKMIIYILISIIGIYISCTVIEYIRIFLFKYLFIDKIIEKVSQKIENKYKAKQTKIEKG